MKNRRHQDLGVKKKRSAVIDIVGNKYYNHCRQGYTMTDMLKPDDPWGAWHGSTQKNRVLIRVRTSEFDYCRFTSGVLGRWLHFESDSCSWAGLSEDILSEEVLSVEEQDGMLTVTTRPSEEKRQSILEDEYAVMED